MLGYKAKKILNLSVYNVLEQCTKLVMKIHTQKFPNHKPSSRPANVNTPETNI